MVEISLISTALCLERKKVRVRERNEGWIPVLRNHRRQGGGRDGIKETITLLYIDNIPAHKDYFWLQQTFNKFGEVKDAFIPNKRSKRTSNKFGFVRYERQSSASMAVAKMNGVWIEKDRLFVKEAFFGQNGAKPRSIPSRNPVTEEHGKKVMEGKSNDEIREKPYGKAKSYAQILNGETSKSGEEQLLRLHVKPSGNGWLERRAVAVMNRVVSMMTLKVKFSSNTDKLVQF